MGEKRDDTIQAVGVLPDAMRVGSTPEPRPFDIAGIPRTIRRADYDAMIKALGIDLKRLVSLRFGFNGIEAEIYAENADGKLYVANYGDSAPAKHVITIPVVD
jgi:hypothetical protein